MHSFKFTLTFTSGVAHSHTRYTHTQTGGREKVGQSTFCRSLHTQFFGRVNIFQVIEIHILLCLLSLFSFTSANEIVIIFIHIER